MAKGWGEHGLRPPRQAKLFSIAMLETWPNPHKSDDPHNRCFLTSDWESQMFTALTPPWGIDVHISD